MRIRCPTCGKKTPAADTICQSCGADMAAGIAEAKREKSITALWIIGGGVVGFAVGYLAWRDPCTAASMAFIGMFISAIIESTMVAVRTKTKVRP